MKVSKILNTVRKNISIPSTNKISGDFLFFGLLEDNLYIIMFDANYQMTYIDSILWRTDEIDSNIFKNRKFVFLNSEHHNSGEGKIARKKYRNLINQSVKDFNNSCKFCILSNNTQGYTYIAIIKEILAVWKNVPKITKDISIKANNKVTAIKPPKKKKNYFSSELERVKHKRIMVGNCETNINISELNDDLNKNIWKEEKHQLVPYMDNEQVYSDNMMDTYIYYRSDIEYDNNGNYELYVYSDASLPLNADVALVSFVTFYEDIQTGQYIIAKYGYSVLEKNDGDNNITNFESIALKFAKLLNPGSEHFYVDNSCVVKNSDINVEHVYAHSDETKKVDIGNCMADWLCKSGWKREQSFKCDNSPKKKEKKKDIKRILRKNVAVDIEIPVLTREVEIKIIGNMSCNVSVQDICDTLSRPIWNEIQLSDNHIILNNMIESEVFVRNDIDTLENYDFHIYSDASMNANFFGIGFISFAVNKVNGTVCVYSCGYGCGLAENDKTIDFYEDMAYQLSYLHGVKASYYIDNSSIASKRKVKWIKGHQSFAINIGNHMADFISRTVRLNYEKKLAMEMTKNSKQLCYVA